MYYSPSGQPPQICALSRGRVRLRPRAVWHKLYGDATHFGNNAMLVVIGVAEPYLRSVFGYYMFIIG